MKYGEDLLGQALYSSDGDEDDSGSLTIELINYLPLYYRDSRIMTLVQGAASRQVGWLEDCVSQLLEQLFVETATWGLDFWETELGIPVDRSRDDDSRRKLIISRIRGAGITTAKVLENIAAYFSGGQSLVIEYPQEYRFVIKFIGARGIPPNMADLEKTVNEIKPAHLEYDFEYTYCIWYEAATYTWDLVKEMTWDRLRTAEPRYIGNPDGFTMWSDIYSALKIPFWSSVETMTWEDLKTFKP